MKVLYVITRSDVMGGASIHLLDLAEGMMKHGHQVKVLIGGNGLVIEKANEKLIPIKSICHLYRRISPMNDILATFQIRKEIKKFSPDIIHIHSSKAGFLGRIAAIALKTPVIFTVHGWSFTEGVSKFSSFIYKKLETLVAPLSNKIITVSDFDKKIAEKYNITTQGRVVTIHNGVHHPISNVEKKSNLDSVSLIMVARFDKQKNQRELLNALFKIKDLPFKITFIGDGPTLHENIEYAHKLGLNEKVEFVGATNNVDSFLKQADVFLLISNWEGFPLTTIEAMSHKLPVIVSNVGGASEAIDKSNNGFVIERGDITSLADKISLLILSKEKREELGECSYDKYVENFSFDIMYHKTNALYNDLLFNKCRESKI